MAKVNELIAEWHHILRDSRISWNNSKLFLDCLANYLVWHKEEEKKNKVDKEVLSVKKVEQMAGKRKSNSLPFSSLSKTKKEQLGLDGENNE